MRQAREAPQLPGQGVLATTPMTAEEFFTQHCMTNKPAIIDASGVRDPTGSGPNGEYECMTWTLDKLVQDFSLNAQGQTKLYAAEAFTCSLPVYRDYARSSGTFDQIYTDDGTVPTAQPWLDPENVADESPMYLFDASFGENANLQAKREWRVPEFLGLIPANLSPTTFEPITNHAPEPQERRETKADLFRLFGSHRPDFRWIIVGPRRSGSGWHKDPNMTSAWNTILDGAKLWLMLPPDTPPPGVYVTEDEAEVTAPLSIAEWVNGFYDETKRLHGPMSIGGDGKLLEGVCGRGETVYVPSGWWHLVINLEECVALTQNFVSAGPVLAAVLRFMATRWDQVSGFKGCEDHDGTDAVETEEDGEEPWTAATLFDRFCHRLRAFDPDLLENALRESRPTTRKAELASGAVHKHRTPPTPTPAPEEPSANLADLAWGEDLEEMPW